MPKTKGQSEARSWMSDHVYHLLMNAGKDYTMELIQMTFDDPKILDLMVRVFLTDEKKLSWHAGWVLFKIAEKDKTRLEKYLSSIIEKLPNMKHSQQCHAALRIIRHYHITDETQQGILVDVGIKFIQKNEYAPNLKYFSIIIIEKIAKQYPELINELVLTVEESLPYWTTNYIVSTGKDLLEKYGKR